MLLTAIFSYDLPWGSIDPLTENTIEESRQKRCFKPGPIGEYLERVLQEHIRQTTPADSARDDAKMKQYGDGMDCLR